MGALPLNTLMGMPRLGMIAKYTSNTNDTKDMISYALAGDKNASHNDKPRMSVWMLENIEWDIINDILRVKSLTAASDHNASL